MRAEHTQNYPPTVEPHRQARHWPDYFFPLFSNCLWFCFFPCACTVQSMMLHAKQTIRSCNLTYMPSFFYTLNIFSDSLPSELPQKRSQSKKIWTSIGVHVPPIYSNTCFHAQACRQNAHHHIELFLFVGSEHSNTIAPAKGLKVGLDSLC